MFMGSGNGVIPPEAIPERLVGVRIRSWSGVDLVTRIYPKWPGKVLLPFQLPSGEGLPAGDQSLGLPVRLPFLKGKEDPAEHCVVG